MRISQKTAPRNGIKPLAKKDESAICLACGECCKRYWITVLPLEAGKISRFLRISKSEFLKKHCVLQVKLYPKSTPGVLTFPSAFLPKRVFELLKKEVAEIPSSFFVVPQVVLRREEKNTFTFFNGKSKKEKRLACTFLHADNSCGIYESRPGPCRLFPFIAMPDFRENYPFCGLFKKTFKDYSIESKIYYSKVQDYFKEIDEKGFASVWVSPPAQGLLFLGDKELGSISLEELLQLMPKK